MIFPSWTGEETLHRFLAVGVISLRPSAGTAANCAKDPPGKGYSEKGDTGSQRDCEVSRWIIELQRAPPRHMFSPWRRRGVVQISELPRHGATE